MKQLIKTLLDRIPYFRDMKRLSQQAIKQGEFPAGHYYSPIPESNDVTEYIKSIKPLQLELPDIELNKSNQFNLLVEYADLYKDLPFPEKQEQSCRFYYENNWYSYSDAIFLYSFLRKNKPKRIIEVGSGFSSAVILDTVDRFFTVRPDITFIEPYPDRLSSLLINDDKDNVKIIEKKLQDVSHEVFSCFESGDFLFIDSSHVVKCGSDLQLLMFEILPLLPPGVFVHFHDIFYPFEYPSEWLKMGRYWNEDYFLRAFLAYNCEWNIYFFNTYIAFSFADFIKDKMPLCVKNPGGSIYIQRNAKK